MNVFDLRNQLIKDYASYIESFIRIRDQHIRAHVNTELLNGLLWPDPLLQLNPNFEPGKWIDEMVRDGELHALCESIFCIKEEHKPEKRLRLHRHQTDAVEAATSGDNYVLTTGTGSGKSLAYIVPIVNRVLQQGSGKGIRAVIIYPMNALANSQEEELKKFLYRGFSDKPPVTFRKYTGQEKDEERREILLNPPDILLTNYVMLELMLTRTYEKGIVQAMRGSLQFLVLDELHTYRGRQGADVSLLIRRVRDVCENSRLQCIGTSATLAGGGTFAEQQGQIAEVATRLFGAEVKPHRVIGETLRRATEARSLVDPVYQQELTIRLQNLATRPPLDHTAFIRDSLSIWLETTFGLENEPDGARLRRAKPMSISGTSGAAQRLADITKLSIAHCEIAIQQGLMAGYQVKDPDTGFPVFAFRLHQFISRGDTVYASLGEPTERYITTQGQQFVPNNRQRLLLPLAFCRECGHEYYTVWRGQHEQTQTTFYQARDSTEQISEDGLDAGYLYANQDDPWPEQANAVIERLPEEWLEIAGDMRRVKPSYRKKLPELTHVGLNGTETTDGASYHFVHSPFAFCLNCGVSYSSRTRSDYGKLAVLSSEGRSTATTILSISMIRALRGEPALQDIARKLLSFTDNRQDASLQAGHFNDFVEVALLRSALYGATQQAGEEGLSHERLAEKVFAALSLPFTGYAIDPTIKFAAKQETERALREILAYRIYQDLRRGWRVTSPNLEQCGLLRIEYASLAELCSAEEEWVDCHPALVTATPRTREEIARTLLDYLRRELAIKVDYLDGTYQERIRQTSSQRLRAPWAIDEQERMVHASIAFPRGIKPDDSRENTFVSARGGFGLYLRRSTTFPELRTPLKVEDSETLIRNLFELLRVAGLVEIVHESTTKGDPPGYQMPAAAILWKAGNGLTAYHDPIRVPKPSSYGQRTNPFFVEFYKSAVVNLQKLEAREHTAQVPNEQRQQREARFRTADLPVLYCSPTMELGVDIAQLNAVNLRNVPPTPANYAQRSGRAGRSGQPALVFTYCTTGSPHDQYFFKRPELMVSGSVAPPRLDLANEDLIRAHVYAVWLAEADLSLGSSLKDLLDVAGINPTLEVLSSVQEKLRSIPIRQRAQQRMQRIFVPLEKELIDADWYNSDWLQRTLAQVEKQFERACERWRSLYRAALRQRDLQNAIIGDASRSQQDKDQAKRLRAEAESQMELLTSSENVMQSDFYSYRYFASEGFLPGYNFPRLPLSAYIPGRRQGKADRDQYLNRPRFLAVSEFGPRSIIYHEGSRYIVNRVILPVEEGHEGRSIAANSAKLCPSCGYLHPIIVGEADPDRCEQCNTLLDQALSPLLRMNNVSTKRRDRINSDEEERVRMGYDLITGVRFEQSGSKSGVRTAVLVDQQGNPLLHLTYGHTATIWRMNLGWRRRKNKLIKGFVLDTERGYWARNEVDEDDPDDPLSQSSKRVIPFAEDRRNCLLIQPAVALDKRQMASLQPALKSAIQVLYQVEDSELAVEPLPSRDQRNFILIYESAEGGAGILRQLLDKADGMIQVARKALELCHYDPDTLADHRRSTRATEDCEAACYDCLMSYYNQTDHSLLDRSTIKNFLFTLANSTLQASPGETSRTEHVDQLKKLCDSDLERRWLDFLVQHNLRLPDEGQKLIASCNTRIDFYYGATTAAIYVDGPVHDHADVQAKDRAAEERLIFDLGLQVLRFRYDDDWLKLCRQHSHVFGMLIE